MTTTEKTDPYESCDQKVERIWKAFAPETHTRIGSLDAQREVSDRIAQSFPDFDKDTGRDIGFHMTDWMSDAAFLLALHLYPDEFEDEEIAAGLGCFLVHAPAHILAAARQAKHAPCDVFDDGAAALEIGE